jgi:hypothetical protein
MSASEGEHTSYDFIMRALLPQKTELGRYIEMPMSRYNGLLKPLKFDWSLLSYNDYSKSFAYSRKRGLSLINVCSELVLDNAANTIRFAFTPNKRRVVSENLSLTY